MDPSFGTGGVVTINPDITGNLNDLSGDIAVRPDGRILMLGLAEGLGQAGVVLLHQLTASGANDPSFGSNGRFLAPETLDEVFVLGGISVFLSRPRLALDDLGRAVVVSRNGFALNANPTNVRVYRFTAAGRTDRYFGDAQRGAVDITNEVALAGTGNITESPAGLIVSRDRILLGMTSQRIGIPQRNMLTMRLQASALFSDGFE